MALTSNQIMRYLALLADPDQNRITRQAWTVAATHDELVWAGWQPDSVVSVDNEPPLDWYDPLASPPAAAEHSARSRQGARTRPPTGLEILKELGLLGSTPAVAGARTQPIPLHDQPAAERVTPPRGVGADGLKQLASLDELHREEALGRVGWLFLTGTIRVADDVIPCCFPLFQRRVRFTRVRGEFFPQWQGALRRNPLLRRTVDDSIEDPVDAFLRSGAGSLDRASVATDVTHMLAEFGVVVDSATDSDTHPLSIGPNNGTVLVPGAGFYLDRPTSERSSAQNGLQRWAAKPLSDTSLADLYRTTDAKLHPEARRSGSIRSALPLNGRQQQAITRLYDEPVVAVSGPPGTGKTHMIVAAASDAVARGLSVLVATKSDFAAESACELLDAYPTPPHVRFGNEAHRRRVADLLSEGSSIGISDEQLESLTRAEDQAWSELEAVGQTALTALARKQAFERARTHQHLPAAAGAPKMLTPGFDHGDLAHTLDQAVRLQGGRQRRAESRLRKLIGAAAGAPLATIQVAIEGARAELAIRDALDQGLGTDLDELWAKLDRCETDARASQAILDIARRSRPTNDALLSIAALATALRSTLGTSGLALPVETNTAFLRHLPFWVGTLDEIENTLPVLPGMFDLVIFDEASQIDQLSAVPALCRAQRVMVVGDPKQLRHTSSITPQQIAAARTHAELRPGDDAAILDIAANSLFDVAASATPVTWLDEHFRSAPHLIQFASERWYGGQLRLMTQHPRNEDLDVIHTYRTPTPRGSEVNEGEVHAIVEHLRQIHRANTWGNSVAVITPFQEQADALESAIATAFDYDAIQDLKLRVGTVRSVQGTERHTILVSLVIDERDFHQALAMVEDPHVFNVMTTRARSRMDIFHSFDPSTLPPGVLADWFRYESRPPGLASRSGPPASAWTAALAEALQLAGLRVVTGYPVAGWHVDLVIGEGEAAFGVETTVHPDGPEAHAERHLTLRRAGWDLVSMFENNWLLQVQDAAVHLAALAARR